MQSSSLPGGLETTMDFIQRIEDIDERLSVVMATMDDARTRSNTELAEYIAIGKEYGRLTYERQQLVRGLWRAERNANEEDSR